MRQSASSATPTRDGRIGHVEGRPVPAAPVARRRSPPPPRSARDRSGCPRRRRRRSRSPRRRPSRRPGAPGARPARARSSATTDTGATIQRQVGGSPPSRPKARPGFMTSVRREEAVDEGDGHARRQPSERHGLGDLVEDHDDAGHGGKHARHARRTTGTQRSQSVGCSASTPTARAARPAALALRRPARGPRR